VKNYYPDKELMLRYSLGWMAEICTYSISVADANLAQERQGVLERHSLSK